MILYGGGHHDICTVGGRSTLDSGWLGRVLRVSSLRVDILSSFLALIIGSIRTNLSLRPLHSIPGASIIAMLII